MASLTSTRQPDVSVEAEQSVIGALLLDPRAYFKICGSITAGDFYRREHRLIFNAIRELVEAGEAVDVLTVCYKLGSDLEAAGGMAYIGELANNTPSAYNVVSYAKIVKEKSKRRSAVLALRNAMSALDDPDAEVESVITACMSCLQDLSSNGRTDKTFAEVLKEAQEEARAAMERRQQGGVIGVSATLPTLDRLIGGFHGPKLIIIGGRPGTYKSAFGWQILLRAAKKGMAVGMISLEMGAVEFAFRAIASELKIDGHAYASGDRFLVSSTRIPESLTKLPIYFDDGAFRLNQVLTRLIEWKYRYDIQIACIDYLQLIEVADAKIRIEAVSTISRQLKLTAKRLNIPVIAISQLSRESEKAGRPPMLSDLRESGSIEQDADIVIFTHCIPGNGQEKDEFQAILAKQRGGPARRTIDLVINGPQFSIGERINAPVNYPG